MQYFFACLKMTSRWVREAEEVFINTQPHISQIVALLLQHYFINIIKKRKNIDSRGLLELK